MTNCIVKPHWAGLFSLINNVITCMDRYDRVQVDWSHGCMYRHEGNAWDQLFHPTDPIPEGQPFDVHANYPDQWLTYRNPGRIYDQEEWRMRCHFLWKKLFVREAILDQVELFLSQHQLDHYLSVLVRATTHAGEQVTQRSQSLDHYAEAIDGAMRPEMKVFVMAGDNESLEWLRRRFPVVCFEDTQRSESRDIDRHLYAEQTIADARQCLTEVLVASQASALVHPVSNMATAALYMEPSSLRSIYLP